MRPVYFNSCINNLNVIYSKLLKNALNTFSYFFKFQLLHLFSLKVTSTPSLNHCTALEAFSLKRQSKMIDSVWSPLKTTVASLGWILNSRKAFSFVEKTELL